MSDNKLACKNWKIPPLLVESSCMTDLLLLLALNLIDSWISSSSDSDLNTLIITSSSEKSPGPVNAIEVAEAK